MMALQPLAGEANKFVFALLPCPHPDGVRPFHLAKSMLTYQFVSDASAIAHRPVGQSRWVVALPFLIAIVLQLLSAISTGLLDRKVPALVRSRLGALSDSQIATLPVNLQPASLAHLVDWGIDVSQALGAVCAPVIALIVLLPNGLGYWTALIYGATALTSFGLFAYVFNQPNPSRYLARMHPLPCTLVTVVGLASNVVFLALALISVQ
jgi:hypothetical protein